MNLKSKIIQIFDVYPPKGQSQDDTIKEIGRRGKIDLVKLTKIVFLLADEIDAMTEEKKVL